MGFASLENLTKSKGESFSEEEGASPMLHA